ncbi:hypothetical protein [Pigmentiphaga kullae]|uniref:hypothetical protein n=1 Tax=Pigmentiphaga kullae TaxID=151784 RepID=UPI00102B1486|nr:hypothetical protein [Pigmentiphaga kullae]
MGDDEGRISVVLLRGASSFDSMTSEEDKSTPLRVCVTDERAGGSPWYFSWHWRICLFQYSDLKQLFLPIDN